MVHEQALALLSAFSVLGEAMDRASAVTLQCVQGDGHIP